MRLMVEKEVNKRVLRQSNLKSSVNLTLLILFSIKACGVPTTKYFLVEQNPVLVIGLVAPAPHRGRLPSTRPLSLWASCLLPHVREGSTSVWFYLHKDFTLERMAIFFGNTWQLQLKDISLQASCLLHEGPTSVWVYYSWPKGYSGF